MTIDELLDLRADLIRSEAEAGERMFLGIPDRWHDRFTVRCVNGHVSNHVIKSEERGDTCPECRGPCVMTFPGDVDDPVAPTREGPKEAG